jgi:uncharacterized protein
MKKTEYGSYLEGNFPKGCQLCVQGKKMVLFVTGICSRGCSFCPLSKLRKNIDKTYSNEREVKSLKDLIEEVKNSKAKGCSLTGGDPLIKFERTISFAKKLKKEFGKNFHIHIYLSTKLVDEQKLKELSKHVDEVRFHPDLEGNLEKEAEKISLAKKFWKKENVGIELPCFPDKNKEIHEIVNLTKDSISFLNLNELEAGEFSEELLSKKYKLSRDGYTIKNSIKEGKKLIKRLKGIFPRLNIHLCTAKLKNSHQYKNRLKNYSSKKFMKMTEEGTLIYFAIENKKEIKKTLKKEDFYLDILKNRLIISPRLVKKLKEKLEIYKIEEYPTFEREEVDFEIIK